MEIATIINFLVLAAGCVCLLSGILGLRARRVPPEHPEVPVDVRQSVIDSRKLHWCLVVLGSIALLISAVLFMQ